MPRAAGLAGLLAVLLAPQAAQALSARPPLVTLTGTVAGAFEYSVIGTADSDQKHNRSEGQIRATCEGAGSPQGTDFVHDYDSPVTRFTTPTASLVLPEGYTCSVRVSWLVGGAGTVGETATSGPTNVDTTPKPVKPRFKDDTKSTARAYRDAARRCAAKYVASGIPSLATIDTAISSVLAEVAEDPADPAFRTRVKIRPVAPAKAPVAEVGSAAPAFDSYLAAGGDAAAAGIALVTAVNRAQGAMHASKRTDRRKFERVQMLDAAGFARRYAAALDRFRSLSAATARALRDSGAPAGTQTVTAGQWDAVRDQLIFDGVPAGFDAELARLHVPVPLRRSAALDLASIGVLLPGTIADDVDNNQTLYVLANHAASMRRWAKVVAKHPTARAPA